MQTCIDRLLMGDQTAANNVKTKQNKTEKKQQQQQKNKKDISVQPFMCTRFNENNNTSTNLHWLAK